MKKKLNTELINEICDNCNESQYCILKDLCKLAALVDERFIVQMKCVEIFKFEESKIQDREIDWDDAIMLWAEEKYAEDFAIIYDDTIKAGKKIHPRLIYKAIRLMEENNKQE